jgi:hypothetical protein
VEDPHWIYPGERLRIPGVPNEAAAAQQPLGEPVPAAAAEPSRPGRAPAAAAAAAITLDLRRPVIPVAEYYSTPWLDPAPEAALVGRVIRLADQPSSAVDRIPPALHPHDRIQIGTVGESRVQAGDSLLLVRLGRVVSSYGTVVEPLALVRVDSAGAGLLTGRLLVQFAEAAVGDQLVRAGRRPDSPRGAPEPVTGGPEGTLLEFLVEQQLYGTGDHGFVAMAGQELRPGDELAVYVAGGTAAEGGQAFPPVEVARALVVRVAERAATVRLTGVFDTSLRPGLPVRLVARVP